MVVAYRRKNCGTAPSFCEDIFGSFVSYAVDNFRKSIVLYVGLCSGAAQLLKSEEDLALKGRY